MLYLSKEDIQKVFTMADAIEANKEAYRLDAAGKAVVPLRTVISGAKGNFAFMPSYIEATGYAGIKLVNVFPENSTKGLPVTTGQVLLIDGETGVILAIMDGTYITALRTAAASGVAFDEFAPKDGSLVGALIGTGSQAECQLEALLAVRPLREVRVAARNYEKTRSFVKQMRERFEDFPTEIIACETSSEALTDADLITTVTVSNTPVIRLEDVKPGAVISAVGSYLPEMQEIDSAIVAKAGKIYCDSVSAVLAESGDLLIPIAEGVIAESDITGGIGDYLLESISGRTDDEEIIVFKNVGIGSLDLIAAKEIYRKAVASGIGLRFGE